MNRTASLVASVGFQILVWRLIWIARLPSVLSDGSNPAIRLAFRVVSPFGCSYVVPLVGSAYVFLWSSNVLSTVASLGAPHE